MISDDERREVARKLRELEIGVIGTVIPTGGLSKNILKEIDYCHSGAMTPYGRLADLIEPEPERTCRDVGGGDKFVCSKCGASLDYEGHWDEPTYWVDDVAAAVEYCPHCGAEVIYDGA